MDWEQFSPEARKMVQESVGYLNFSSGSPDPRFLQSLNQLFSLILATPKEAGAVETPAWRLLGQWLRTGLAALESVSGVFRESDQAAAVLRLVFEDFLPAYRQFHRDLLFHQTDEFLFQPFFLGRACEAVLSEGPPWNEPERIVPQALRRLNDYLGHRPVAVLRTEQKIQPYAHEWVRPIPLYIAGAGVGAGTYHDVVTKTLEILRDTDATLLRQAWFDLELLEELAVDPRAHDFDHPVNRRPNYHFGSWDPHHIDNRGFYRRFVLQQVTLEALWSRVAERSDLPYAEMLFEAAAVLAGTMLMGSAVTGNGPDAHDSSVTLARLLPHIAHFRDSFYERLLGQMTGAHGERLRQEAKELRQPFAGARQHLNQKLARRRAEQLQYVHLARLFAQMGYTDAARRQVERVPTPSARMQTEITCLLTAAHLHLDRGRLEETAAVLPAVEDLLERAIQCGALVDPWNILGFGGQFSLFPSPENSVHDHRVDELIELINEIFSLYARLEKQAAATGQLILQQRLSAGLQRLAQWWDQFASTEVSEVEGVSGGKTWESAEQVAAAVRAWHEGGTATADLGFWRRHVQQFRSPKAYALLVEALLEQRDLVAAMALLTHWMSQAGEIGLSEGRYSFHELAVRWLEDLWQPADDRRGIAAEQRWPLSRKFLDYLEANAEEFWEVPKLDVMSAADSEPAQEEEPEEEDVEEPDGGEDLFGAAYENVTYRDTTDDGLEADMMDVGSGATDFELTAEADRISRRLAFLGTLARLWRLAAGLSAAPGDSGPDRDEVLAGWLARAGVNRRALGELLAAVHRYTIPAPRGTFESLVEYDRRRAIKEALTDRVAVVCVETADAARMLHTLSTRLETAAVADDWESPVLQVLRALLRGDAERVRDAWPELLAALVQQPLLYVPTARGGNPHRIVASRNVQEVLRRLLAGLPRLGLLSETYQLIGTIEEMERNHRAGPGAITEFDRLFEIGCRSIVDCVVYSSATWTTPPGARAEADKRLIELLETIAESLLRRWLEHSRNIRISVLESVAERDRWQRLKAFIQHYGHDLFSQKFMNYGNLRAILQQGVDRYLAWLEEEAEPGEETPSLVAALDREISRDEAQQWLELTIEAVVENYAEYVDYNSTTTQSDRGEMLYTLLDFLRLEASYDRVAWNLKPVVTTHEALVRAGMSEAARKWRRAVARRSAPVANEHLRRFERLSKQYGMRLPSVAERLGERFVRPLAIDRLRALVRPSVEELRQQRKPVSFALLEREIGHFTQEPGGVGFDLPSWLEALEEEVERVRSARTEEDDPLDVAWSIPRTPLAVEEIRRQIGRWEQL